MFSYDSNNTDFLLEKISNLEELNSSLKEEVENLKCLVRYLGYTPDKCEKKVVNGVYCGWNLVCGS